jgi:flagellar hook-associated protein 1 FlgK
MADLLATSVSGLLAFQRALDVTSNNVANSATPGYSVESVNLSEQLAQASSSGFIGSGVRVTSVTRAYDEALATQVRSSQSNYSGYNTYATLAAQVDNMLSATGTGLTAALQSFSNSLHAVANSPASTSSRQALLSQAQSLVQQLKSYDSQVAQYGANVDAQITNNVTQVNSLATQIAKLNTQIAAAQQGTGQPPNDLLDKRDSLIDQLSQYVQVSTTPQGDGEMNVYIGSGQGLVIGGTAQALAATTDPYNASRHNISIATGGGATVDITSQISGGSLGGLLAVRSQVLDPTQNALGQISVGLATLMNQQQQSGMDLTGALGTAMFSVGGVLSAAATTNTGNATVSVTRTNLSALTADNYRLQNTGGTWQLTDTTTGAIVPMTGSGTSASPFQAAGLSIVVNGAAASGDGFSIQPTAGATAGLSLLLTSPTQIAAASPVRTAAGSANTGSGTISSATVLNPADPNLLTTTKIQFTSATTYSINGAGSFPYSGGSTISANGWSVQISGTPAAGDTFTVSSNAGGTGDNTNVLAMVDQLASSALDGGTTSLMSAANNLVSDVGVLTQSAQNNASTQKAINTDAVTSRSNVSGVNLDEEAAKLVSYQQAYQACAQMIQASNTIFNSLITAVRGG